MQQDAAINQQDADIDQARQASRDEAARNRSEAGLKIFRDYQQQQADRHRQRREDELLRSLGAPRAPSAVHCTARQVGHQVYTDCQ